MLSLGALALLERPALADRLRTGDLAPGPFVEEILRHLSVVQVAFPRFARTATQVGDVDIAAGDIVICSLAAANRDAVFGGAPGGPDPEHMDPARPTVPHLAFGYGIHRCLGAELGRMELRSALPALLRRLPGLRLAVPAEEVEFRTLSLVHGVRSLPVTW